MKWFGEPWPSAELRAPVCEDDKNRVPPPPAGEECSLCGLGFKPDARGVVMPHLAADKTSPWIQWAELRYCHIGCLLGNVGGEGLSWREPETGPGKTIKTMSEPLSLYTIYDHPTDVPEPFGFVVRRWAITKQGAVPDTEAQFTMTLDEARALVPPGLYCLERVPEDDPKIVETWL